MSLLFLVVLPREVRKSPNYTFTPPERSMRLVIPLHSTTSSTYYKPLFKFASRRFHRGRLLYTATGVSTFQVQRLLISGDVSTNPGPRRKSTTKHPCSECSKSVRRNQNAILCAECNTWSHARCLKMSSWTFQYYLNNPSVDWICSLCALPEFSDSFFSTVNSSTHQSASDTELDLGSQSSDVKLIRNGNRKECIIVNLNVNSLPSKFEEIKEWLTDRTFGILSIQENKIDRSFPNSQFYVDEYKLFRATGRKVAAVLQSLFVITSLQHVRKALQHQWNHSYSTYTSSKDVLL